MYVMQFLVLVILLISSKDAISACIGNWYPVVQYSCVTESLVKINGREITKYEPVGFRVDICASGKDFQISFGQNFSLLTGRVYESYDDETIVVYRSQSDWAVAKNSSIANFKNMTFNFADLSYGHPGMRTLTALCEKF